MSEPASTASDVSRYSFEQLDTLVRVTSIHAWVGLATLFAVCAAAVTFALLYEVPTKVNGEGILLIDRDTLTQVRAQATGRLVALGVKIGDRVAPGDVVGELSQDDLKDLIREETKRLADLERDDLELARFEQHEKETQDAAMARLRDAIERARDDSRDSLRIAARVVTSSDRLRAEHHLGDIDLLSAREKFYQIRDALNQDQSKLAELELTGVRAASARRRGQLERQLKIRELKNKLALDEQKLARTSVIVSHAEGEVAQLLTAPDELIREGSPIVLLHSRKTGAGVDDTGSVYESIVFVPAGEGKKIGLGDPVEVSPATVKREEHGYIRGAVVAISELPATRLAIEAALQHPDLADTFLKRFAPGVLLRLHVRLEKSSAARAGEPGRSNVTAGNPFRWSSSSGPDQSLKTGTLCQAAVIVEKRRLISLILPWTHKLMDAN